MKGPVKYVREILPDGREEFYREICWARVPSTAETFYRRRGAGAVCVVRRIDTASKTGKVIAGPFGQPRQVGG